jgi:hypothetical protein
MTPVCSHMSTVHKHSSRTPSMPPPHPNYREGYGMPEYSFLFFCTSHHASDLASRFPMSRVGHDIDLQRDRHTFRHWPKVVFSDLLDSSLLRACFDTKYA